MGGLSMSDPTAGSATLTVDSPPQDAAAPPAAEAGEAASIPLSVPATQFALSYLKLGSTSIGGRSASYLLDEFVHRRHWLRREDWFEGLSLGLMLPGPVGASCAMFLSTLLRGPHAAIPAYVLYVLPGVVVALLLSMLIFGGPRPAWANGAIAALSASAFGLFFYVSARNLPASRKTRLGPLFVALAFVAHALLHVDLFVVLLGVGAASLLVNRPSQSRKG
jgi:chromate transporter